MAAICIARQPIVDVRRDIHAYELLFRENSEAETSGGHEGHQATAGVVLRALIGLGLDRITASRPAFINCPQRLLNFEGLDLVLPPELVVLEVLEKIEPHPIVVRKLRLLAERGFRIALDDFVYDPRFEPLLELAHYVKIDVQALGADEVRRHAALGRAKKCVLIAEKVESYDEFRRCVDLGFDLFQGWFFCKPETLKGHLPETGRLTAIQVIARLHEADAPIDEVVRLVTLDAALSYCVVRLANSSLYARPMDVESVHDGVMRLGIAGLRRWVSIMLMAGLQHKPRELLVTAIVRARMCEILGREQEDDAEASFTIGLFSVLDALFDRPLAEILDELPLSNHVTDALLYGTGPAGRILRAVVSQEQGKWEQSEPFASQTRLTEVWLEALEWSQAMLRSLGLAPSHRSERAPKPDAAVVNP